MYLVLVGAAALPLSTPTVLAYSYETTIRLYTDKSAICCGGGQILNNQSISAVIGHAVGANAGATIVSDITIRTGTVHNSYTTFVLVATAGISYTKRSTITVSR